MNGYVQWNQCIICTTYVTYGAEVDEEKAGEKIYW